ncbi:hypothetical protein N7448_010119 [Penicillium atrosanguineum]|uniref:F-box domain-containing protein n=1 Tax=Penicillium atrosanguineum TaxID=1132637 RepID=A0A9W9KU31_9EURO|nr:Sterol 24-C-methyltransferase [Penicillium atrosanguineum]KAJ5118410.1 hypothetical protein N7526_010047 [Penicillium atrosanguineum]KAJ5119450.1 hypothetical protein N7448_010119 [Penicillium atrosanguineum]KAJ5296447.1 Sterol 24-C-methyltransferase [Penicillium atrosanguineum]KAJ5299215.1 hypothetical protein N7476_010772 [Penicillium atrosanguineum]
MASRVEEGPVYGAVTRWQTEIRTKSATKKGLDIPEILELILARMDMRTLLTSAQRVCHDWAKLISKSPSIQKALFFTPIKNSKWGVEERILNPLLKETFPSFFPAWDRTKHYEFNFSDLTMTKDATTMAQFVRKDASWRKMLVQQPPASDVGLFHIRHGKGGDSARSSSIPAAKETQEFGNDGLRMERLFELLLFSHQVQFLAYTKARVYWSTEEPILFNESSRNQNINDRFYRILSKFGLLLYTREVKQCCKKPSPPSAAELVRKEIIAAYEEHDLDVNSKKKDIEESKVEVSR